jgi:hypothetical protein
VNTWLGRSDVEDYIKEHNLNLPYQVLNERFQYGRASLTMKATIDLLHKLLNPLGWRSHDDESPLQASR